MPDTSQVCKLGYQLSGENTQIRNGTERLIFLTMSVILNLTVLDEAKRRLKKNKLVYWSGYLSQVADKLFELVALQPDGNMSSMGVKIVEIMACFLVMKHVNAGSMRTPIRVFLKKHSTKAAEIFKNSGMKVGDEYPLLIHGNEQVLRCMECKEAVRQDRVQTLEKRHEKISFGVYAGFTGMMNNEQVHAAAAIPKLRVCKAHLFYQAEILKELDLKLLDEEFYEEFKTAMHVSFGKGIMEPLKMVNCYINKHGPPAVNDPICCKFCKFTDKYVHPDELLQVEAHWRCFQARAVDIQWSLRYQKTEDGVLKVTVPTPEELETLTGDKLENAIKKYREWFGKQDVTPAHERLQMLILFARYWQHDPSIDKRLKKENALLPRSKKRDESPESPDSVWDSYYKN